MRPPTRPLALLLASLALAGCAGGMDESMGGPGTGSGVDGGSGMQDVSGMMGMDGGEAEQLAMARLDEVPEGPLAWVAFDLPATVEPHAHAPAFVYAANGTARVEAGGEVRTLMQGEARFVAAGETHAHPDAAWEIRLADPDAAPPEGATLRFSSGPLEGVPQAPVDLRFVRVTLPPGAMTSVHAHPGPEYVWVARGEIEHESGPSGAVRLGEGEDHALPPGTPVQKRNAGSAEAVFLSFFVADPDEPFVMDASLG